MKQEREQDMNTEGSKVRKPRGFAALSAERRRDISSKGGVSAHVKGSAHEWNTATAREAGRKGGLAHRARHAASSPPPAAEPGPPSEAKHDAS